MKKLILIAIACLVVSTASAQGAGWQKVYNNNYSQQPFNQVVTFNDGNYTGTATVNFPAGASNIYSQKDGNSYYVICYWNNSWYRKSVYNISWPQRNYYQQFNSGWNCQVSAPSGYNYTGYSTIGNNYYANYWYDNNYYQQPILTGILNLALNITNAIRGNSCQCNNSWGTCSRPW